MTSATAIKRWLAFAALALIWGSTWVASDSLAELVSPLLGTAARFLLAALLLLPLILLKRWKLPAARGRWVVLLLSAGMLVLPSVLLLWARAHLQSATVTVLFAAMPLVVAFLTPVFAGKSIPRSALQATIVGWGAIMLAAGATLSSSQAAGVAVVLLAVASIGASSLFFRRELSSENPCVVTALLLGAAAPLLLLAGLMLESPMQWDRSAAGWLAWLAVAAATAYPIYFWLLQRVEVYQVATVQWVQPLVAMTETAILLRLRLSSSMIAGTVVTLICLWVVMRARPEDDKSVSLLGN